jgi:hypothetical protein
MKDSVVYVYYAIYRRVMRIAHRYHWHYMEPCYPDGDTMLWCHWCGIRIVTKRRERSDVGDGHGEGLGTIASRNGTTP